jgi:hypothetical protein
MVATTAMASQLDSDEMTGDAVNHEDSSLIQDQKIPTGKLAYSRTFQFLR